jgi:inosose dehydratase
MKVGCFALVDPFQPLGHQLGRIAELGFRYADVTDNHPGSSLGREFGFSATVCLDDNPADIGRLFEEHGPTITSFCAHASLLDPSSPSRYGTSELMQTVKLATLLKVPHVITTEGEPSTPWGEKLTFKQQVFTTAEK